MGESEEAKERRRAYQRDLMRKRRAEAKLGDMGYKVPGKTGPASDVVINLENEDEAQMWAQIRQKGLQALASIRQLSAKEALEIVSVSSKALVELHSRAKAEEENSNDFDFSKLFADPEAMAKAMELVDLVRDKPREP